MLALLVQLAFAHPGAAEHLHETEATACDPEVRSRRLASLLDEGLLDLARAEVGLQRGCPLPSTGAEVGEARLLALEGHPDQALALLAALLDREPGHPGALEQRAAVHAATHDLRAAAADLVALARAHPTALDAWRGAAVHAAAVDPALALAILDEARAHHPTAADLDQRAAEQLLALGRPKEAVARLATAPESVGVLRLRARALVALGDPSAAATLDRALALCAAMRASPARDQLCADLRAERGGVGDAGAPLPPR